MRFLKKKHRSIEDMLIAAYHEKARDAVDDGELWENNVMCHIRNLEPSQEQSVPLAIAYKFIWRSVVAACILVFMFSIHSYFSGFHPQHEAAKILVEDPVPVALAQMFGEY